MKPLIDDAIARDKIMRLKRNFGIIYGASAGAVFAVASWGLDGYLPSISHAYFPWVLLLVGLVFYITLGGSLVTSGWIALCFTTSPIPAIQSRENNA